MSTQHHFSYVFNEKLQRVFDCFTNYSTVSLITYNGLISEVCKIKGNSFNEINAVFTFLYKNYYHVNIKVNSFVNSELSKEICYEIYNVKEIPNFNIKFLMNFYWNTTEHQTLLTFDFIINDKFFKELFEEEINEQDVIQIVHNVNTYLKFNIKDLECNEATIIKGNIKDIWNFICDWNKLFAFVIENHKIKLIYSTDIIQLGTQVDVIEVISNKNICSMKVRKICLSNTNMEIEFVSWKEPEGIFKRMITRLHIVKLSDKISFVRYRTISLDYICLEVLVLVQGFIKRCIQYTRDHFNKVNASGI
jgi:hypothetical protein